MNEGHASFWHISELMKFFFTCTKVLIFLSAFPKICSILTELGRPNREKFRDQNYLTEND